MPRYVALLRAINVGGRTVKMDKLRALFETLELRNVETLIASGNVLFDSTAKDVPALETRIERHLEKSLGYKVETFVRTAAELAGVVKGTPFAGSKVHTEANALYVGFLKETAAKEMKDRVVALCNDTHEFRVVGREYYWSSRTSMGQSPDMNAALGKAVKVPSTVRNITTVRKLAELAAGGA
ncbi:MAG TPA: DUF1697 domain-containing protein [Gemmatimonadaceae bacterium]